MQVGAAMLTIALWLAVAVVAAACVGLLVILIREWKDGTLW